MENINFKHCSYLLFLRLASNREKRQLVNDYLEIIFKINIDIKDDVIISVGNINC